MLEYPPVFALFDLYVVHTLNRALIHLRERNLRILQSSPLEINNACLASSMILQNFAFIADCTGNTLVATGDIYIGKYRYLVARCNNV